MYRKVRLPNELIVIYIDKAAIQSLIDKPLKDSEYSKDRQLIKSCSRLEESLKNHVNTFKSNVFTSEDRIYTNDQNLITKYYSLLYYLGSISVLKL